MKFSLVIDPNKEEAVVATVHAPSPLTDRIEQLIQEYTGSDKLTAYREDELLQLPFSQIECITVLDGKTYAIDTKGQRYRLKERLYTLEAMLPSSFIRINKSAIANENHLDRFVATYSGGVNARFKSGYEEYVSRRCFAEIKRRFTSK